MVLSVALIAKKADCHVETHNVMATLVQAVMPPLAVGVGTDEQPVDAPECRRPNGTIHRALFDVGIFVILILLHKEILLYHTSVFQSDLLNELYRSFYAQYETPGQDFAVKTLFKRFPEACAHNEAFIFGIRELFDQ